CYSLLTTHYSLLIQRLAAVVLDVLPARFDLLDDVRRHRDVVEVGRHLAAVLIRPGEERERRLRCGHILRLFWYEDEGRAGDRPCLRAGRVGEDHVEAGRVIPVGARRGGGDRLGNGRDRLAVLVDHLHRGQVILLGVGGLDVADRAFGVADVV